MTRTLTRMTLRDQAEKALREMIAAYRFTPGTWINVDRLAKDLGVSRTPVSQALKNLEKEGFVRNDPRKGFKMARMTLEMARDLYSVRGLLEGLAGRLATEGMRKKDLNRMRSLLDQQRPIVEAPDVVAYSELDFTFHEVIYNACGNWLLKELLENIKARSRPFVCDITSILPTLFQDHVEILNSLKARDPDRAENALIDHNRHMARRIESSLASQKERRKEISNG